jgi:peroxiredoxin
MATLTSGKKAPPFELEAVEGAKLSLAGSLAQGPALVAFFKVSCPTCQFTFPFMERIYQQFRAHGIQVVGISQDDATYSRRFAKQNGATFPVLIDAYPYETSRQFGVKYVPTLFLIMPDGRIELMSDGFSKVDLLEIQKLLAQRFSVTPPALFQPSDGVPEFKPG